jgi:hypothetical protein
MIHTFILLQFHTNQSVGTAEILFAAPLDLLWAKSVFGMDTDDFSTF